MSLDADCSDEDRTNPAGLPSRIRIIKNSIRVSKWLCGCAASGKTARGNIDRAPRASGERFAQEKVGTLFKSTHVETNAGARTSAACKQLGVSFFGEEGLSPGTVGCSFDFVRL